MLEAVGPTTTEVPPPVRRNAPVNPRAYPELGTDQIRLVWCLSNPNPGHTLAVLAIENHGREAPVSEVSPELRDIVGGGIKDRRTDAYSNEPERPQVAVPHGPSSQVCGSFSHDVKDPIT